MTTLTKIFIEFVILLGICGSNTYISFDSGRYSYNIKNEYYIEQEGKYEEYRHDSDCCEENVHQLYEEIILPPTDLKSGRAFLKCYNCDSCVIYTLKKLPHTHKYVESIEEPTCTKEGLKSTTCYCGDIITEELPIIEHTLSDWLSTIEANCHNDGQEMRQCNCGYKETRNVPKTVHNFNDWEVIKNATCTENGLSIRTCSICNDKEYQNIDKIAHTYKLTKQEEATPDKEGKKIYTCTCNNSYTETIPKVANRWKWEIEKENAEEIEKAVEYYASDTLIVIITKTKWGHSNEVFLSHVFVKSPSQLKVDMANGMWNNGIGVELPSSAAKRNNAVLLTNGGNFSLNNPTPEFPYGMTGGWHNTPRIIRGKNMNGVEVVNKEGTIGFFKDGDFRVIPKGTTVQELYQQGIVHTIQFGPTLVDNYKALNSEWSDYGNSYCPRTVWGIKKPLEYYVMVSSGEYYSNGMSYDECASLFEKLGCRTAINFDGGGSSTLIYKGRMLNVPGATSGPEERRVTDFVFFTD